jgi:hypothetical protein
MKTMAQDPAVLIYYKDIQMSTRHWDADARGWYFSLLMEQADKPGGLPNDIEDLSVLAGVKPSQYERFKLIWSTHLSTMFAVNTAGLLVNKKMEATIEKRRGYKLDKAIKGTVGAMIKKLKKDAIYSDDVLNEISRQVFHSLKIDLTKSELSEEDKEEIKLTLKHTLEAYASSIKGNANGNGIINNSLGKEKGVGKENPLDVDQALPKNVLEAAEMNQFTHTKSLNTDFILSSWKTFLNERVHDPPLKVKGYIKNPSELYQYFLNWIRNKFPKKEVNGTAHITGTKPLPTIVGKGGFGKL